jgi:hypothetical protein
MAASARHGKPPLAVAYLRPAATAGRAVTVASFRCLNGTA